MAQGEKLISVGSQQRPQSPYLGSSSKELGWLFRVDLPCGEAGLSHSYVNQTLDAS